MKTRHLVAVLLGLATLAFFAADASAMYHPTMGRFMQRDPGSDAGAPARLGTAGPALGGALLPRDPTVQYAQGMDLYAYCGSNPVGRMDPRGTDFIAVTDRQVRNTLGAFYHYAVEYWVSPCTVELHKELSKADFEKKYKQSQQNAGVELLRHGGWRAWKWDGVRWKEKSIAISVIHYSAQGTSLMPIFQGTPGAVKSKWDEVVAKAQQYGYAEQEGFFKFAHWPDSIYETVGNNSNTFARTIVKRVGLTMNEMKGWHPGRMAPKPITDLYSDPWPDWAKPSPKPEHP